MRLGIVQQDEVGKHLDGPIGDELIDKGVLEGVVPELQQQPSVKRVLGLDVAHARDPLPHLPEDALKDLRIRIMKVFCNLLEVVSRDREVIGVPNRLLDAPGHTDVKIRDVPVFDQPTQFVGCPEPLELSQPLDGEDVPLSQVLSLLRQFLVRLVEILLVRDRFPDAVGEVQEVKG